MIYGLTRVNTESGWLHTTLGITEERALNLSEILHKFEQEERKTKGGDMGNVLIRASNEVTSLNELAFMASLFGGRMERENRNFSKEDVPEELKDEL